MAKIVELTGAADASGDATLESTAPVTGYVEKVVFKYVDTDDGTDFVLTGEGRFSEPIITVTDAGTGNDLFYYPRAFANRVEDASTADVAKILLVSQTLKAVVADAGTANTARILVYLSDE